MNTQNWPHLTESWCPHCQLPIFAPELVRLHDDGAEFRCPHCQRLHTRKEDVEHEVYLNFPGDVAPDPFFEAFFGPNCEKHSGPIDLEYPPVKDDPVPSRTVLRLFCWVLEWYPAGSVLPRGLYLLRVYGPSPGQPFIDEEVVIRKLW